MSTLTQRLSAIQNSWTFFNAQQSVDAQALQLRTAMIEEINAANQIYLRMVNEMTLMASQQQAIVSDLDNKIAEINNDLSLNQQRSNDRHNWAVSVLLEADKPNEVLLQQAANQQEVDTFKSTVGQIGNQAIAAEEVPKQRIIVVDQRRQATQAQRNIIAAYVPNDGAGGGGEHNNLA